MDQVPRPMSGQGTVASSLPETTTSLLRPYVCVFVAPAPLMCAHVCFDCFLSLITLRTRMTQLRTPHTKELRRLRRISLIYRLPHRPAEIYTPLPPRQTLKDRDSDIMAYYPLSEPSSMAGMHRYFYPSLLLLYDKVSKPKRAIDDL
jgi:hypothetical protein